MKMNKMQFICTLLSDVILSQNAGSKENQSTLDYIPGNVFLGIAASGLYSKLSAAESMTLFHSGKVCFGDAHPLFNDCRSRHIILQERGKVGRKRSVCYAQVEAGRCSAEAVS